MDYSGDMPNILLGKGLRRIGFFWGAPLLCVRLFFERSRHRF